MFDYQIFMPHGHCYLWKPTLLWLHVISDLVIGLSYFSIPLALIYFKLKSKNSGTLFNVVIFMFIGFIIMCGTTHLLSIYVTWIPNYWLSGMIKGVTAIFSIGVAIALWPLIPEALKIPSPQSLRKANQLLEELNQNLADKIAIKTAQLQQSNAELTQQIEQKTLIENQLKEKALEREYLNHQLQKSQQDYKNLNLKLIEQNNELQQFVYTVAHDLKSPLISIHAFANQISRKEAIATDERLAHLTNRIIKNSEKMNKLLNDLLELTKISHKELQLTPLNLKKLIHDGLQLIDAINTYDIEIHVDDTIFIEAQENLFFPVVTNLITNAIKYQSPQRTLTIEISSMIEGDTIYLSFGDNGKGIDPIHHHKIFKVFERFHPEVLEGTGVGLPIVKKVVERHNWQIDFETNTDQGTTFRLSIPRYYLQNNDRKRKSQ